MAKLDFKTKAAYATALVSFTIGWTLVCIGFFMPPKGEVHQTTLYILGEAMIYTASVFGVALYFNNQMVKFKHDARRYMDSRMNQSQEINDLENEEYEES